MTGTSANLLVRIDLAGIDDNPLDWYGRAINSSGRVIGAMLPYELPYWDYIIQKYRYAMLPFTRLALQYYADPNIVLLNQGEKKFINEARSNYGIPIDKKTFELTLFHLAADFPINESLSWQE